MSKRAIAAINVGALPSDAITSPEPVFEWVDPSSLLVDEAYQRGLSEKSLRLIRKIVAKWQWARFKPPIVARTEAGLEVIDGQHTAIAAASHPCLIKIPVMVVEADSVTERAQAFIGQNRDRLTITRGQMHTSALAAGDEEALAIASVCEKAGVTILKNPPPSSNWEPGQTVAIAAIRLLIDRRGAEKAAKILTALADLAPVSSRFIKAVEEVIFAPEFGVTLEAVEEVFERYAPDALENEADMLAFSHRQANWRALAAVIFKRAKKPKRAGGGAMRRRCEPVHHRGPSLCHASLAA